jgi:hypothetical protein
LTLRDGGLDEEGSLRLPIEREIEQLRQDIGRAKVRPKEKRIILALTGAMMEILRLRKLVSEYEKVDGLLDELVKIQATEGDEAANRFLGGAAKSIKSA